MLTHITIKIPPPFDELDLVQPLGLALASSDHACLQHHLFMFCGNYKLSTQQSTWEEEQEALHVKFLLFWRAWLLVNVTHVKGVAGFLGGRGSGG